MDLIFLDCKNLLTGVEASELYKELNRGFTPKTEVEKFDSFLVDTLYGPHKWDIGVGTLKRPLEFRFKRAFTKFGIYTCQEYFEDAKVELDVSTLEKDLLSSSDDNVVSQILNETPLPVSLTKTPHLSCYSEKSTYTTPVNAEILIRDGAINMSFSSSLDGMIYGISCLEATNSKKVDTVRLM